MVSQLVKHERIETTVAKVSFFHFMSEYDILGADICNCFFLFMFYLGVWIEGFYE